MAIGLNGARRCHQRLVEGDGQPAASPVADTGALLVRELHYRLKGSRKTAAPQVIRGASQLRFDSVGQVTWHRDYWDAAEELYARLPGIGCLMRLLKRKLAA